MACRIQILDGPGRYAIVRRLLTGDALSAFNLAATMAGNKTLLYFKTAVRGLISHIFPARALVLQKQYMRKNLRKPSDVKTQVFISRLVEINTYLNEVLPFG